MKAPNCLRHSVIETLPLGSKSQRRSHDHSLWSAGSAGSSRISPLDGETRVTEPTWEHQDEFQDRSRCTLHPAVELSWARKTPRGGVKFEFLFQFDSF